MHRSIDQRTAKTTGSRGIKFCINVLKRRRFPLRKDILEIPSLRVVCFQTHSRYRLGGGGEGH